MLYKFQEHALTVEGEKDDLLELVQALRSTDVCNTLSDLAYQIEYEFDVDGIRSQNEEA